MTDDKKVPAKTTTADAGSPADKAVTQKTHTIQALLAVLGVNIVYGPLYMWGIFTMFMRMSGQDTTGHGGIFKSCYTNGPGCMGPNYLMVALGFLAVAAGFFLAGFIGAKAGQYKGRDFDRKLLTFTVLSIPLGTATFLMTILGFNPFSMVLFMFFLH